MSKHSHISAIFDNAGPNPGLKLAAAYFSRKEIVRLYRRSRLI